MRFASIGAGARGTIYAAHLAVAGHEVQLIARGERARRIAANGIRVLGAANFTTPCNVTIDSSKLGAVDVLIVAVKTYDTEQALAPLAELEVRCAFSVQNGVRKDEALQQRWGEDRVVGAISMLGGEVLEATNGAVEVRYDMAAATVLGSLNESESNLTPAEITAVLKEAGLRAETSADIRAVEWSKFVGWSGVSAVSVLTRLPTAAFLSDPRTTLIAARVMRETAAVAAAVGVNISTTGMTRIEVLHGTEAEAVRALVSQGKQLSANSPMFRQSILQDASRGRPLEVSETLGYTLELARQHHIEAPTLEFCCAILRSISDAHRAASA